MGWQAFYFTATFSTTNRRAEAVFGKRIRHAAAKYVRSVHPAVVIVVWRHSHAGFGIQFQLFKSEFFNRLGRLTIRQARKNPRHRQGNKAGVFTIAERAPLGVLQRFEYFFKVARFGELSPVIKAKHA